MNVLRASASADAYRKGKIMEQLTNVRKLQYSVNQTLSQMSGSKRNPERVKLASTLSEKLKALRVAEEALGMYAGLEEQRRRTVISIVENVAGRVKSTSTNVSPLKHDAGELRELYASTKETELAVEALRALAISYALAPPMTGVMLSEPATRETAPMEDGAATDNAGKNGNQ